MVAFPKLPKEPEKLPDWVKWYLSPHHGRRSFQAFQFTINGVTYPFVRDMHFAALPQPIDRRYSMLAGLYLTRPGDLLFFFQSDPQWSSDDINSRRGMRGIYRVVSRPFSDTKPIEHPSTHYKILGVCPSCGTRFSNLQHGCIEERDKKTKEFKYFYPNFQTPNGPYHLLVMNLRLDIEPLVIFERSVSDERAYADMSDSGMIWIGRHDNQMGRGKGSSIRQLLPEEAVKLSRLMMTEPSQKATLAKKIGYPHKWDQITNDDGVPADHLEIYPRKKAGDIVADELEINFHISKTIDQPGSSIQKALGDDFVLKDMEYLSTEFPWGYTAGTADFVYSLTKGGKRYKIVVMEFKRDWADDAAVVQSCLYVRWVVQILSQFAQPPPDKLEVVPIVVARRPAPFMKRPEPWSYSTKFISGAKVDVAVKSPRYIEYKPVDIYSKDGLYYAKNLVYTDKSEDLGKIVWEPPKGVVTSQIERDWVMETSWAKAKNSG